MFTGKFGQKIFKLQKYDSNNKKKVITINSFIFKIVLVDVTCLITQKKEFRFHLTQNSNNNIDIIGHETDSQLCPAFWKFMEKILSD